MLIIQPIGGWLAHKLYKSRQRITIVHYAHRWIGRIFLVLGAINAGLGLELSHVSKRYEIAYGLVAAFFFALWAVACIFNWGQSKKDVNKETGGEKAQVVDTRSNDAA